MSASMYPPAHSYPAFIPTAAVAANTEPDGSFLMIESANVAQLRTAIELQQADVRRSANGLQELCSLLNRRLMEGASDTDPAVTGVNDPVFNVEFDKLVRKQNEEFERTMENFDFNTAIDRALKLAERAFEDAESKPDTKQPGRFIEIDMAVKNRPLIEALRARSIGDSDVLLFAHMIQFSGRAGLFKSRRKSQPHFGAQDAALEAFAVEISKPGFELKLTFYEN